MIVTLTEQEEHVSGSVGLGRHIRCRKFAKLYGVSALSPEEQQSNDILGAQGELAAAKALGIYWPPSISTSGDAPDLPPDWQIRTSKHHHHTLIVRPDDPDDHRYVLVTGSEGHFIVHGWIYGRDAKRPEWLKDKAGRNSPCYWVPQTELQPIKDVP